MANTTSRNYPKPVNSNLVSGDVNLLKQAFDMVDVDVANLLLALAGKAAAAHGHDIAAIIGLETALSGKAASGHNHNIASLEGVSGLADAPNNYVLYKTTTGWVPGAIGSVLTASLNLVAGDLLVVSAAGVLTRLPKGTDGQVLKLVAGAPAWANP